MKNQHILILDDKGTPSVDSNHSNYTDFTTHQNKTLIIISSINAISQTDKENALAWRELDPYPTRNGLLEKLVLELHKEFRIDMIYTHQEELVLRAAHLRELLGIEKDGLRGNDALFFRDKYQMKKRSLKGGFPTPPFKLILTPTDVLQFIQNYGFPVLIKPTMGAASAGINVLRNEADRDDFLKNGFYSSLDECGGQLDHTGSLLIEKFVNGSMFHCNGYAKNGKIIYFWPFTYLNNNLSFTQGSTYGNMLIPKLNHNDSMWQNLYDKTQALLECFPNPKNLFFHIELFDDQTGEKSGSPNSLNLVICEFGARKPGGTIGNLIDRFHKNFNNDWTTFLEFEFRVSIGLQPKQARVTPLITPSPTSTKEPTLSPFIADLMVPLKKGLLVSTPTQSDFSAFLKTKETVFKGYDIEFLEITKPGSQYSGYDINMINTCARFVAARQGGGEVVGGRELIRMTHEVLGRCVEWFERLVVYRNEFVGIRVPELLVKRVEVGKIGTGNQGLALIKRSDTFESHVASTMRKLKL